MAGPGWVMWAFMKAPVGRALQLRKPWRERIRGPGVKRGAFSVPPFAQHPLTPFLVCLQYSRSPNYRELQGHVPFFLEVPKGQ